MAVCTLSAWAINPATLRDFAAEQNKKCPFPLSEGVIEESVVVDGENLVIQLLVDNSVVPFQQLKEHKQLIHDTKVAELSTDSTLTELYKLCADDGVTIVYTFTDGTDSFAISILPAEL